MTQGNCHNENIDPDKLGQLLKKFIKAIERIGLLKKQHKTCVNLRYKGDIYQFLAEWKERSSGKTPMVFM